MLGNQAEEEVEGTRKLTGGQSEEFSEPRSEPFLFQRQGSLGNSFLRCIP